MPTEAFSLLLPVYRGDRPDFLRRAFRSSVDDQTLRPDEVVVVRDGPVSAELARTMAELAEASPVPVVTVELARNMGLAYALERGLEACAHDIVARMDADASASPSASPASSRSSRTASTWSAPACTSSRTRSARSPAAAPRRSAPTPSPATRASTTR